MDPFKKKVEDELGVKLLTVMYLGKRHVNLRQTKDELTVKTPADLKGVTVSSFNRLWTLMHGPTITLPVENGPNDMPVGVQLAAKTGDDPMIIAQASRIFKILMDT